MINGTHDAFLPNASKDRYIRYAEESEKWILGPMPVEEFLDEFLPRGDTDAPQMPDHRGAFKNIPQNAPNEAPIYEGLIAAINDHGRCPSVKFFDTSTLPQNHGLGASKQDLTGYDANDLDSVKRDKDGKIPANLGLAELFAEVKVDYDPFDDPHPKASRATRADHNFIAFRTGGEARSNRTKQNLGQNVAYAAEACARQHRAFYFSLSIVSTRARFIRWDRAGAIVTQSFDYKIKPQYLCDFLWRFHLASAEQRGYDPCVVIASQDEENLFREVISENVAFQLGIDPQKSAELAIAVECHYEQGKVTKMDVYNEAQQTVEQYLVSRPLKSPAGVAGRSTRGYWAVKVLGSGGEIAFLKDTWRIDVSDMEAEGLVYGSMLDKNVVNISELHSQGDVPDDIDNICERLEAEDDQDDAPNGQRRLAYEPAPPNDQREREACSVRRRFAPAAQCTRTNEFVDADWVCRGCPDGLQVVKHTHYRLALKEVGYPLKEFTGSRELFDGAGDAFEALTEAYEKCNRLHRDVSLDNIILVRSKKTGLRRGILIDWELSTVTDGKGKARDYFRSGTWAYMSGASLEGTLPEFRHANADDMESVLYVVLYCSVRWLPHGYKKDLGRWMYDFFDSYSSYEGRAIGGVVKRDHMNSFRKFTLSFQFTSGLIQTWFSTAYDYLATSSTLSKERGLDLKWTIDNVRGLFKDVRRRLPENDRVDHGVADIYKEINPNIRATHTSKVTGTGSRVGPSRGTSKRTLNEADEGRAIGSTTLEEPQRDSKRIRTDMNEGRNVVTGEGTSGQGQNSRGHVSTKNSSRKQSTRRNAPITNEGPSGATGARSSSRHTKSGGRASRRNSPGKQGQRQSARLAAKASSSSIKRGS